MKYRKKLVIIEAFQFCTNTPTADWPQWAKDRLRHLTDDGMVVSRGGDGKRDITSHGTHLVVTTPEGDRRADDGDWIIKGFKNGVYPCKPDVFTAIYEPAE